MVQVGGDRISRRFFQIEGSNGGKKASLSGLLNQMEM